MTVPIDAQAACQAAYVAAWAELPQVVYGSRADAGKVHYKYASLSAVLDTVRPVLAKHQLAITHGARTDPAFPSLVYVSTSIVHVGGGRMTAEAPMPVEGGRVQGCQVFGSLLSYGRRYTLLALLGLATDDDDGAASLPERRPQEERRPAPTSRMAPAAPPVPPPTPPAPPPAAPAPLVGPWWAAPNRSGWGEAAAKFAAGVDALAVAGLTLGRVWGEVEAALAARGSTPARDLPQWSDLPALRDVYATVRSALAGGPASPPWWAPSVRSGWTAHARRVGGAVVEQLREGVWRDEAAVWAWLMETAGAEGVDLPRSIATMEEGYAIDIVAWLQRETAGRKTRGELTR